MDIELYGVVPKKHAIYVADIYSPSCRIKYPKPISTANGEHGNAERLHRKAIFSNDIFPKPPFPVKCAARSRTGRGVGSTRRGRAQE